MKTNSKKKLARIETIAETINSGDSYISRKIIAKNYKYLVFGYDLDKKDFVRIGTQISHDKGQTWSDLDTNILTRPLTKNVMSVVVLLENALIYIDSAYIRFKITSISKNQWVDALITGMKK